MERNFNIIGVKYFLSAKQMSICMCNWNNSEGKQGRCKEGCDNSRPTK